MAKKFSFTLDKFSGINYKLDEGVAGFSGYSADMVNFNVTPQNKLQKREGYSVLFSHESEGRGIFCATLSDKECVVYVAGNKVYLMSDGEERELGELESESGEVDFLLFSKKLYILDGVKIMVYDTETFKALEPYRPLVAVSTTPDGAGVAFEEKNLLTGAMRQTFTMNGTTSLVQLAATNLDSVDYVKVGGEVIDKVNYAANLEKGTVQLKDALIDYEIIDGIEIGFTKSDGRENELHRMRHAVVYGGENDTRVFLWGDMQQPDLLRFSGVSEGKSLMEYFPENSFNKVGTKRGITSVLRHYDRLVIFCPEEAFYACMENVSDESGRVTASFPTRPLSDSVGCSKNGFGALVENMPITFDRGTLYRWRSTSVRDERYAEDIGERVRKGFETWDKSDVGSFDNPSRSELYVWSGNEIFVYNYGLDAYYLWRGISPAGFANLSSGDTLFQRRDGSLCRLFGTDSDGGEKIRAWWTSTYLELCSGVKNLFRAELSVLPEVNTSAELYWISDHGTGGNKSFLDKYRRLSMKKLDFTSLGFMTSMSPSRLFYRLRHKRFERLRLRLESPPASALHLLSLSLFGAVTDKK